MDLETIEAGHVRAVVFPVAGPPVAGEADALDLMGEAMSREADWIALPVARLAPDFFRLETRTAGEISQKLVNYQVGLAVVGDVSDLTAQSRPLRDWVYECNRGRHIWFVTDLDELRARLSSL